MSTEIVKELDAAERVNLANQTQKIAGMSLPQVDVESGNQFVFVAHFDGTRNDKDNLALSDSQYPTNVARLHELMAPHANGRNYVSHYEPGVGTNTDDSWYTRTKNAAFSPSGDMHAAAERAYERFSNKAYQWLKNHPDADPAEALNIIATGFSRGGGTAAVFSQMLYERGLKDPENGNILVAPGVLGLSGALIFDPVTTNYEGNERFSPTSRNINVIRAQHEYRTDFKGVNYGDNPHINIVEVMGNHCDIGGGYDRGIAALVLENSREMFSRSGLRLSPLTDEMRHREDEPIQIHRETFYGRETHNPHKGVETGAPRQLETPSALAQEFTNTHGWRGFNSIDGTTVWHKDYPEASPDTGGIRRAIFVEKPGGTDELYLTHHDGQVGYYQPQSGAELTRQAVDRLSRQEFPSGKVDLTVNMDRPRQIVSSQHSRDAAATQSRGEIADAFAADPSAALERYPDNKRVHKAVNVLDAVNQAHADSRKRQEVEANAKNILADQLRHDRPLLDPRLAGIQSEALRDKITASPTLQTLLKETEAEHRPYTYDIFNDSYREGMNDESLVGAVMTERKRRFPTLKRNDPKGWNEVQKRLTHSEQQTLERLAKEKGAEATSAPGQKPEQTSATPSPEQRQAALAIVFKRDPAEAARTYPELESAHKALETVRSRAGTRAATAIHRDLSKRIELGKTIPTPQQAMKMVQNALDRGR